MEDRKQVLSQLVVQFVSQAPFITTLHRPCHFLEQIALLASIYDKITGLFHSIPSTSIN